MKRESCIPAAVPIDDVSWPVIELAPGELRVGETVMRHWPSPAGMGILTRERCLIAGHPHPVHRRVLWSENLADIKFFDVMKEPEAWLPVFFGRSFSLGGGVGLGGVGWTKLDDYYAVVVDNVPVFVGYIDHCEMIQQWIDEAKTARTRTEQTQGSPSNQL